MTQTDSKKAHTAVLKARTVLLVTQPFFGCLALHLELVEIEPKSRIAAQCKTMAVDGIHMYYWTPFVLGLSEQELIGVVAHEVMHCASQHMTRRSFRNPVIYNMAGDYVINDCLLKAGFSLPKKRLHDPKYANMSTEEVYERIKNDVEKQIKKQSKGQKGQGQGQGKGGQGENGDEDGDGSGGGLVLPDTDLDIDPGECGGVLDAAGAGEKHKNDQVDRDWEATVRMAVGIAKRANAGNVPGYLERLVAQLQEPRVSWRELTRMFIDNSMAKDYSWSRPNRRYAGQGMILPGFVPDALHHMIFAVDTSGSIDQKMLQAMVSEIGGALNDGTADKLTVVYADTRVAHVDEFLMGDQVTCDKIHGGGGTCFNDTMRWVKENAPDAQCLVYLTDMLTGSFGEDPGMPVMWAAYLPKAQLASITPPFGMIVPVDTSE